MSGIDDGKPVNVNCRYDCNNDIVNNMSNSSKVHINPPIPQIKAINDKDDSSISYYNRCGILGWRPNCLQKLRSIYLFLLTMCIVCIIQTALSAGYMSSQITTLERRFSLDSYMIGVIQAFFDVGFIASVAFVSFFGGQGRIPLWIGCGMLIMSVGAFSFAIPEFITTYEFNTVQGENNIPLCFKTNGTVLPDNCLNGNKADWLVKLLFIIGQVLIGCGSSPVLSLGPTYIDDHVIPTLAPPLIAMLYASSALGPVFGFGIGATMLRYPASSRVSALSKPGDVDWVGAWWFGYTFLGTCAAVMAIFLFLFPKQVRKIKHTRFKSFIGFSSSKNTKKVVSSDQGTQGYQTPATQPLMNNNQNKILITTPVEDKVTNRLELHSSEISRQLSNESVAKEYGKNLRDLPGAILSLLRNKVFIIVSLAICCEMFLVNGFAAFLPKYIETEYKVSNIVASLIAGGLIVPSGALGIIVGGVIMHRFQMSRRRAILFSIVAVFGVLLCLLLFFITGCQNPDFAGFNVPIRYQNESYMTIDNSCNQNNCVNKCNNNSFNPVCDKKTGITYFSACFAGCDKYINDKKIKTYYNCSCPSSLSTNFSSHMVLESGECPLKCNSLITFVLFLTMALFLTGITQNPLLMATMRSVQKHERAFALGFQFVILRFLAYIPSPIIYGSVIDAACVHWKRNCKDRGDCLVTDLKLLNQYLIGLSFAVKLGAAVFYVILFFILPKHIHILNPESEENDSETNFDENNIPPVIAPNSKQSV